MITFLLVSHSQFPSKKLTVVGTMRKNKPELPPEFTKTRGREVMSTLFGFQKDVMIASYCPKKNAVRSITIGVFAYSKDKNNCQNRNKHNLLFLDAFRFNLKLNLIIEDALS